MNRQDTIVIVPQYPYCIEENRHDVPLEDWYARPQLFFKCTLRPKDGRRPKNPTYRYGQDDLSYYLVFFSTFEAHVAHQGADGGRWGDQAVRTIPNTVSLRGYGREHCGQGPPDSPFSGG